MLHLWYSNDLERLVAQLSRRLMPGGRRDPVDMLRPVPIVVPNRNLQTYLEFEIARRQGIAANLEFLYLDSFLKDRFLVPDSGRALIDNRVMTGLLLSILVRREEPRTRPIEVARYLDASGLRPDEQDRRSYQLAARLATLFENYSRSRPDFIRSWSADEAPEGLAGPVEAWQRALWLEIFGPGGLVATIEARTGVRWMRVDQLVDETPRVPVEGSRPVHLFGIAYVSRVHQELLVRLVETTELNFYHFALSAVSLEDRATLGLMSEEDRTRFPSLAQLGAAAPKDPPPTLDRDFENMMVRLWGKPAHDFLAMMLRRPQVVAHPELHLIEGAESRFLGRIQQDVVRRSSPASVTGDPGRPAPDGTLRVLACPGIRREVEVVANEIWRLIREDETGETEGTRGPSRLRFNDIAVIVADTARFEIYRSHVQAVFHELHDLPVNVSDMQGGGESRLVEGVEVLLDLIEGEFRRPELLRLLTHPAFLARFTEADPEAWVRWCDEAGIFHGADHADLEGSYVVKDLHTWDQGIRRLTLGTYISPGAPGEARMVESGSDLYLPCEVTPGEVEQAARFGVTVRSLIADARHTRHGMFTLEEWADTFAALITTYLAAAGELDEPLWSRVLKAVRGVGAADPSGRSFPFPVARAFLEKELSALPGGRGQYLADGVVVSSFTPMRPIPFRVIFIMGLGEGRFPLTGGVDAFDLVNLDPRPGDVDPRERDKYLFLQTLASARDRLILSYVDRDNQTGDPLNPSTLVQELQFILERTYLRSPDERAALVEEHPLRRYDRMYRFGAEASGKKDSFSLAAWREARARELRERLRSADPGERPPSSAAGTVSAVVTRPAPDLPESTLRVPIAALRRFLECPLQGWARFRLGLTDEDDDDLLDQEDEPFHSPFLGRMTFLTEVFHEAVRQGRALRDIDELRRLHDRLARQREHEGRMPTGLFQEAERKHNLNDLSKIRQLYLDLGLDERGPPLMLRFGPGQEGSRADRVLEAPRLTIPLGLPGPRLVTVELTGSTALITPDQACSMRLSMKTSLARQDIKPYLHGFCDSLLLAASGVAGSDAFEIVTLFSSKEENKVEPVRRIANLTRPAAEAYLGEVLTEMLTGTHDYLMPVEMVETVCAAGEGEVLDLEEVVEEWKVGRARVSSDHGPVPHPRTYPPPDMEDVWEKIRRRFRYVLPPPQEKKPKGGRK